MKRPSIRRVYSLDKLPMVRFWFHGPKWRSRCEVSLKFLADVSPSSTAYHKPGKVILVATLEEEIRERILERLYHDRYAMWSDPREHFTVKERARR